MKVWSIHEFPAFWKPWGKRWKNSLLDMKAGRKNINLNNLASLMSSNAEPFGKEKVENSRLAQSSEPMLSE